MYFHFVAAPNMNTGLKALVINNNQIKSIDGIRQLCHLDSFGMKVFFPQAK